MREDTVQGKHHLDGRADGWCMGTIIAYIVETVLLALIVINYTVSGSKRNDYSIGQLIASMIMLPYT